MNLPDRYAERFDEYFDVVVVGYGFAGAAAAIEAHDHGARVLLIEKMAAPGGISICAGGGLRIGNDPDKVFAYLEAANAGTTPPEIHRAFAAGMAELKAYFERLAEVDGARIVLREREGNYPFAGHDSLCFLEVESIPGFDAGRDYPHAHSLRAGPNVFKLVDDNVRHRGIEVRLSTPALRLITGPANDVRGVWVRSTRGLQAIGARRAVVLCCGGFENAADLHSQFWQLRPVLPVASRGNTGDGVRMAQDLGAALWHMWHYHGSYGFRHPDPAFPFGIRMKRLPDWTPGSTPPRARMSWIALGRDGRRFMNEYHPYLQDTGHRPLDQYDPALQRFPYVPAYVVVDDAGRGMYPLGKATFNDPDVEIYSWSDDNLREVELGILRRAESVEALAALIGVDAAVLRATLTRWNEACAAGVDTDFQRPGETMVPVATPPFFVGEIWPVVSNTQGGPVHNARQQVLNAFGGPIPRLYEAGELGGMWGFLYLSGGNLSECFVGGRIAGRDAAQLAPWDATAAAKNAAS